MDMQGGRLGGERLGVEVVDGGERMVQQLMDLTPETCGQRIIGAGYWIYDSV